MTDTLSNRIKLMRKELGQRMRSDGKELTLEEFGRLAGVSAQAVSQWEYGSTKEMRFEPLYNLEKNTGYSRDWIFFGKDPKHVDEVMEEKVTCAIRKKIQEGELLDISRLPQNKRVALTTTLHLFEEVNAGDEEGAAKPRTEVKKTGNDG